MTEQTTTGPGDWVKVVLNQEDWRQALADAGIKDTRIITHEGCPGFIGEPKELAMLMLTIIHYIGLGDASLLASIVRTHGDWAGAVGYYFVGLQLL